MSKVNLEWRKYSSEEGHFWKILSSEPEKSSDSKSSFGDEAVYCQRRLLANKASLRLLSANEVDPVSKQEHGNGAFHVILECVNSDFFSISRDAFEKKEAINLVEKYLGMSEEVAIKLWTRQKVGQAGFRIDFEQPP